MNLEENIAKEVINGFAEFKPERIGFYGEELLVSKVIEAFRSYRPGVTISANNAYRVDVDKMAEFQKSKRQKEKEASFEDYWGADVAADDLLARSLFKSQVPLNAEGYTIYRVTATTSKKSLLKVIPMRLVKGDLVSSKEIYILAKQHLGDEPFYATNSIKEEFARI